jgi:kynurenine formamidase
VTGPAPLPADQVGAFHKSLSNWGRFGERDQLGALNFITSEKRRAAAASVRSGRTVSCARPLPTRADVDNPSPVAHHMIGTHTEGYGGDYFALAPHGFATSHIDALCHIFHEGRLYNGYATETVTAHGALELGIHELRDGIVSRGVLLDIPLARGVAYLEPGDPIFPDDLETAERNAGITVEEGDVLLVSTGRWALREERGAWDVRQSLAGLDASCLPWLYERRVAALGCDGVSDVVPSRIEGMALPIHSVAIVAMGLHLLDNLELRDLARACGEEGRWEFLLTVAPLVLERGTASPVNPIALF